MTNHHQVYSAESSALHLRRVFVSMFRGMVESPYPAYRLAKKDIKAAYAKSAFGMVWDLIDPLVLGLVFWVLRRGNVIDFGEMSMPYPIFVIYGMLIYSTFSESLTASVTMLSRSKGLLSQLKLRPEALVLSVVFRVLFNSIFRIIVMLGFSIALGAFSAVGFAKFLALYGTIILAGMSIGIFLAPFHTIYNDVGRVTGIVLTPYRYLTPVLWPIPNTGLFVWVNLLNPISPILSDLRLLATSNEMHEMAGFGARCGIFSVIFLVGWFIFHLAIPVLADRA